jgi:hypothetical protein
MVRYKQPKFHTHTKYYIVVAIAFCIIGSIIGFILFQNYNSNNTEKFAIHNTSLEINDLTSRQPLPGKTRCFDCEADMIRRADGNINAGAHANPTMLFSETRGSECAFGTGYYGNPSRLYSADIQLLG